MGNRNKFLKLFDVDFLEDQEDKTINENEIELMRNK